MSNKIIPFCDPRKAREDVRRQACDWLVEIDAGLSTNGLARLSDWLVESPAHGKTLLEMASFWDQAGVLSELSALFPLEQCAPATKRNHARKCLGAAAAAVMVLYLFLDPLWKGVERPMELEAWAASSGTYATDVGDQLSVRLSDGSAIILNTNTLIDVLYSAGERSIVLLRGEGHFTVAPEVERPFRVRVGERVFEATGTAFTVYAQLDTVEVTVTEGSVNLLQTSELMQRPAESRPRTGRLAEVDEEPAAQETTSLALLAGESAIVDGAGRAIQTRQLQPEEIEARLAWRHGMLLFQGDPLESVLREVSRYTTTRIEADTEIHDIPVHGYFRAGDIDRLLAAMRDNFQIDVTQVDAGHILLTAR